jgi:hypothetical protein
MQVTVRDSFGKSLSFTVPLKREAEAKFMKDIENKGSQLDSFNALMNYLDRFR